MVRNAKPTFSLRLFFAFSIGIAILCVAGFYRFALAGFAATVLHFILFAVGNSFANRFPTERNPLARYRFIRPTKSNDTATVIATSYLVFFYCWHMFPLMVFLPAGIRSVWYPPSLFGLSLYAIEHCVIAMYNVFMYVNFFGDCYGTGYVCPKNCAMTSSISVVLMATHLRFPMLSVNGTEQRKQPEIVGAGFRSILWRLAKYRTACKKSLIWADRNSPSNR